MVPKADWDAPAHLQYEPITVPKGAAPRDPSDVTEFDNLREAVHWAMTNEAPAGMQAVIRTSSGAVLGPAMLEEIWLSLQGP